MGKSARAAARRDLGGRDGVGGLLGILGGCGGAGASALCAAVVAVAARQPAITPVLIDLDPIGGGLDVALGAESVPGARWSGLHATGGRLDPEQLLEGLPRWQSVPFLACDGLEAPGPHAVRSVLRAARQIGPIVIDLGRASTGARSAALEWASSLVIVVPSEIRAVTAAAAALAAVVDDGFVGPTRLVVREDSPVLGVRRIADVLALELAGAMAPDRGLRAGRDRGIDPRRFRRGTRSLAGELLAWAASAPERSVVRASEAMKPEPVTPAPMTRGPITRNPITRDPITRDPMAAVDVRPVDRAGPALVNAIRPEILRRDVRAGDHRLDDAGGGARGPGRARIQVRA